MQIEIIGADFILACLMFLSINWLGKHSYNIGYMSLSAFYRADDAPAFNLLFRLLAPVIFVVLTSSVLYSFNLDEFVKDIWLVTLFCCALRITYILIFELSDLVNWKKEIFTWVTTTLLTWVVYSYFIENKSNLLPESSELKNQFWIIIILYIYSIMNSLEFNNSRSKLRKLKYLQKNYAFFKNKFGSIISNNSPDVLCQSLIYAVLINENFNRPKIVRGLEHLVFPLFSKTLGPMQVTTTKRLSDNESVNQGSKIIAEAYLEALTYAKKNVSEGTSFNPFTNSWHMEFLQYRIASKYNRDDDYVRSVNEMHNQLLEYYYPTFLPRQATENTSDYYLNRGW